MPDLKSFPVFAESGQIGRVLATARYLDDRAQKTILLANGKELNVPADALEVRRDGSFFLRGAARLLDGATDALKGSVVAPIKETVSNGSMHPNAEPVQSVSDSQSSSAASSPRDVPVSTATTPSIQSAAYPHIPAEALFQSGYDIETIAVNKVVEGPVEERHEGDTLVLPVLEEVWVVEKKLYLRQEIRITRRKIQVSQAQTIEKVPGGERPL